MLAFRYVETELSRNFLATPTGARLIDRIPAKALGCLEDMDGPMCQLCPDVSTITTRSGIVVDGGHQINSLQVILSEMDHFMARKSRQSK